MGDSPAEWYASLPPISKFWFTSCVASTLGVQFGFLQVQSMMMYWPLVRDKFQVWRILSNFMFIGKPSFAWLIRLSWIARYAVALEKSNFIGPTGTADFMTFLAFGALVLTPLALVVPSLAQSFYSTSLIFMCLYMWSRENLRASVSLFGLVRVGAFWFPWAMLALTLIMGGDPTPDFLGVIAGHLYYFFARLYPLHSGRRSFIRTPGVFVSLANYINDGSGVVNVASNAVRPPQNRYFQGAGRRLAD
jgi:Derlin-2/3